MKNVSDKSCRKTQNVHVTFSNFFFIHAVYDNLEKHRKAELATDDNMVHARCMLDNQGYKYTCAV
jgi:hypothetical protein